jgi:hypothetical protein
MDYIINSLTTSRLSIRHLSRARSLGRRHQVCALAHGASPWVVSLPLSGRTRRRCVALGMAPLMGGSQGFPLVLGGEGVDADRHRWERQPPHPRRPRPRQGADARPDSHQAAARADPEAQRGSCAVVCAVHYIISL